MSPAKTSTTPSTDVPDQLTGASLFAGIGGLDLGFERAGIRTLWQCEIDPYCLRVLRHHWPSARQYSDVRSITGDPFRRGDLVEPVDVLYGGFPCQPFSLAGKREAQADPRHLWPEFARLVGELRPRYVVGENVRGLASKGLDVVLGDLASLGYDAEWQVVSAAALGAPHIRERVFVVAYAGGERRQQESGSAPTDEGADGRRSQEDHQPERHGQGRGAGHMADANGEGRADAEGREGPAWPGGRAVFGPADYQPGAYQWAPEPDVGRVAHGVPHRMDRLRALGNAVVPQVGEYVGRLIVDHHRRTAWQ